MKHHFKKTETGYHKFAVQSLASWVQGVIEQPFYIDGAIAFVPDVVCYENGILSKIYEIVYSHPLNGKKLGLIMDWCYRNASDLSIFEVSADFILSQTEKPERIITMECYTIDLFNNL